ncbi:hypothetical protein RUM44_002809 [Polyplax serrata]|uniref:Fibronectin type III domain-containing protein n=1 Tax=Polyplax serrata TaxID=468196 RepID=A0ABR1AHD3_POLSC
MSAPTNHQIETIEGLEFQMSEVAYNPKDYLVNGTGKANEPIIIVRAEEALIILLVLALWIAAIALFFNRWGKIRMLEPYQPKFIQQHRPSCPMVDPMVVQHRSISKFNLNGETLLSQQKIHRPRQNSVFVGSSLIALPVNTPRKAKSAFDLQDLVLSDPALDKNIIRINFDGYTLRRQSLLAVSSSSNSRERPLSFRDLVNVERCQRREKSYCYTDKESQIRYGKSEEVKQRPTFSNESSLACSGQNSITTQDLKPPLGISSKERKNSLFITGHRELRESEFADLRPDMKNTISNFRRNSALFNNLTENERNYLCPRDNIKSGVIDFRRNSMLIINNLTEDIGCRLQRRDHSLGGSNIVLGSDFTATGRRNSAMFPYAHDGKHRTSAVQFPGGKTKIQGGLKSCRVNPAEGKLTSDRKPSKSLDCGDSLAGAGWNNPRDPAQPFFLSETDHKYLLPSTSQASGGSSSSLSENPSASTDRKPMEESASDFTCSKSEISNFRLKDGSKTVHEKCSSSETNAVPTVDVTTSLMKPDLTGGVHIKVVTSSRCSVADADPV